MLKDPIREALITMHCHQLYFSISSLISGTLDCLAGLSSKLEKVTEAEARSQQPPQPVQPSSQDSSQPMSHRENTATMSCRSYL